MKKIKLLIAIIAISGCSKNENEPAKPEPIKMEATVIEKAPSGDSVYYDIHLLK